MGNSTQLPYIIELLDDESPLVREAVKRELASYGFELLPALEGLPKPLSPDQKKLLNQIMESTRRRMLKKIWSQWFTLNDDLRQMEAGLNMLTEFQSGIEYRNQLTVRLDQWAEEFKKSYSEINPFNLAEFLFQKKHLRGAIADYYNPQNSNLLYVMDHKRGIPISLTSVLILLGHRLGLKIRGCNLPRHFLAAVESNGQKVLLDCFNGGKPVDDKDIVILSQEPTMKIADVWNLQANAFTVMRRVLGNLIWAYQKMDEHENSYLMVHLLKEMERFKFLQEKADIKETIKDVRFEIGQLVRHKHKDISGIVVESDLYCLANEIWYQRNFGEEDRNQPWYQILVHGTDQVAYEPHNNLESGEDSRQINHPLLTTFFDRTADGMYVRNNQLWID